MNPIRELLDTLAARRRLGDGGQSVLDAAGAGTARADAPPTLDAVLGGHQVDGGHGACWYVRTRVGDVRRGCDIARFPPRLDLAEPLGPLAAAESVLVDIETGGFAGTPAFLVGLLDLAVEPLVVEQWLTRDYSEEQALVRLVAERLSARDVWVSFNGKSFDEPFLRDRAAACRVSFPRPRLHVDILHAARRAWRSRLPDCRLATLERRILGVARAGDVPSADVPELFHHFLRTGRAGPLRPVLEHNRQDLVTSLQLLLRLGVQQGGG